jgi:uncharacterized protein (TIGR02300 family)
LAKPGLGTKRLCPHCGAKFYDLEKDPIMCPKCGSEVEIVLPTSRGRPEPRKAAVAESEPTDEATVPLEDADAEESTGKVAKAPTDDDDVEVEDDESEDDDTFLEDEEDGDDDVSDIIGGDIDKEDET